MKNKWKFQIWIVTIIFAMMTLVACAATPAPILAEASRPSTAESAEEAAPYPDYEEPMETGESYLPIDENREKSTDSESVVTFSLKVDTASYSNTRRYIENGQLPPVDAVKVEELINYFNYDAPVEFNEEPLGVYTELGKNPFDSDKYMAYVRVKAQEIDREVLPPCNLTFLIDTSGSMDSYDKLPLLKEAFALLTDTLRPDDRVSIVTYAGSSAVVLDSAYGREKAKILNAIYNLEAGGSTAGSEGIWTAYQLAQKNLIKDGNNRVILATDGDFNVGMSSLDELSEFISTGRDTGVYLSTLGFGTGNLRDDIMETLAKDGNGNYSYIDSAKTAEKVLVDELGSNLFTIADDVKAQVEFNPANVKSYRLIGYENRQLENEEFNDDKKDAGEIGVGTDVVALFELELINEVEKNNLDLKYQGDTLVKADVGEFGNELFEVRVRYKYPGEQESNLILNPVTFENIQADNSQDFNFACSVAEWGMQLSESPYAANASAYEIHKLVQSNLGKDEGGYRAEHLKTLWAWEKLI